MILAEITWFGGICTVVVIAVIFLVGRYLERKEQAEKEQWSKKLRSEKDQLERQAKQSDLECTQAKQETVKIREELTTKLLAVEKEAANFKDEVLNNSTNWELIDRIMRLEQLRFRKLGRSIRACVTATPSGNVRIEWLVDQSKYAVPRVTIARSGRSETQNAFQGVYNDLLEPGVDYQFTIFVRVGSSRDDEDISFPIRIPTAQQLPAGGFEHSATRATAIPMQEQSNVRQRVVEQVITEAVAQASLLKKAESELQEAGLSAEQVQVHLAQMEARLIELSERQGLHNT